MERYENNKLKVIEMVQKLIKNTVGLTGQWSVDVMQNDKDFYLIDMAVAETSALYECVPKTLRKKSEENWIPKLK